MNAASCLKNNRNILKMNSVSGKISACWSNNIQIMYKQMHKKKKSTVQKYISNEVKIVAALKKNLK